MPLSERSKQLTENPGGIEILPVEALKRHPLEEQPVENDTGVNVLVDLAHQCNFTTMWKLRDVLNTNGYRYVSTHACLHSVLTPGALGTVRVPAGKRDDGKPVRLFARWPNAEYNVIVTMQRNMLAQDYLPEEIDAVERFVREGGGLVVFAGIPRARPEDPSNFDEWPLRRLLKRFGADMGKTRPTVAGHELFEVLPCESWEIVRRADAADGQETGPVIICRRTFGKGRVVVASGITLMMKSVHFDKNCTDDEEAERTSVLLETLEGAARGKPPVGGSVRLPSSYGGAGSIYPERTTRVANFTVFHAANQKKEIADLVEKEFPEVKRRLFDWLPSPEPTEPMALIMAAGIGGGWAVNTFRPRENGVTGLAPGGILGLFGHELAHTMSGPLNEDGRVAGRWRLGNNGEAHAQFFQRKITACFGRSPEKAVKGINDILRHEAKAGMVDLSKGCKGLEWRKAEYVWFRLDEIYGTTWYPRWRWVQHTRWRETPNRRLSIEDSIEDMSIAVGEDLFPFFKKIGTTLTKERCENLEFDGIALELPVAEIEYKPVTEIHLEPAGDYREPLGRTNRPAK